MPSAFSDVLETIMKDTTEILKVYKGNTLTYNKVALNFDEGGGGAVANKNVYTFRTYGVLPTPIRSGYTFDGWFTASSGGSQVLSTTTVTVTTASQTLYAQWTSSVTQTVAPNIQTISCDIISSQNYINWYVKNLDSSGAATIYTELNDSTPDLKVISGVSYNSITPKQTQLISSKYTSATIYAKALVSGETLSEYDSVVYYTQFCS